MSRQCGFCGRWFRNKQATRSHLRFCEKYKNKKVHENAFTQRVRLPKKQPVNDDFIDDFEEDELSENYFCSECQETYHEHPDTCNVCGGRIEEIVDYEDEPIPEFICVRCGSRYHDKIDTCPKCNGQVI